MPASRHDSVVTRTHTSSPGLTRLSTRLSPSALRNSSTARSRSASPGSSATGVSVSADDNWLILGLGGIFVTAVARHRLVTLSPPPGCHVFVLDPLLEQNHALEQRLGTRWAPGNV